MTCSSSSNEALEKKGRIMYVAYDDNNKVCNALDTDIEKANKIITKHKRLAFLLQAFYVLSYGNLHGFIITDLYNIFST